MNVINTSVLISMVKGLFNHLSNNLLFFQPKRNIQGSFTAYGIEMGCMKTKGEPNCG